jgi:glycosyltransferase involved in cell wall biosynthesis
VSWADEIWVVDSNSSDRTVQLAERAGAKVAIFDYTGHGPKKKNWSLRTLPFRNEWLLVVDADERVRSELVEEIRQAVAGDLDGYYVRRDYVFLGRALRCFRPNWNLRLFRHRLGEYELLATNVPNTGDNEVHEHVLLTGRVGYLRGSLVNEDRRPLRAWIDNHNRYSDWEADVYKQFLVEPVDLRGLLSSDPVWRRRAVKRIWVRMPMRPIARFAIFYLLRGGFLDGWQGFAYAVLMGYYEFLISLKLR